MLPGRGDEPGSCAEHHAGRHAASAGHEPGRVHRDAVPATGSRRRSSWQGGPPSGRESGHSRSGSWTGSRRDGRVVVVVDFGGFLGFGARSIAVPVDAMVLLGQDMEIVAFTPEQLRQFPTFSPFGTTDVANDAIIEVGLAKPSH